MGWGNCGWNDAIKKEMGYAHEGICAHPGCEKKIDHGLSYVCGGMHQGGQYGCGDYFCTKHLAYLDEPEIPDPLCVTCMRSLLQAIDEEKCTT